MATGSMLIVIGDFAGVDKGTVSRVLGKVVTAIAELRPTYVKMPSPPEYEEVIQGFYAISRFPRCIGAIDCTHIRIQSPGGDDAENYRNRKGFFSFNVQVVCDSALKIRNIVCRWPGSAHDAHIFRNSNIKLRLQNGEFQDKFLIGDSGYGVKPYLLTPIGNAQTPAERLYNEALIRTRNTVERCFGVWKRRFPVLSLGIRLHVSKVEGVVIAAGVLHNIACDMRDDIPAVDPAIDLPQNNNVDEPEPHHNANRNEAVRIALVEDYFQQLANENGRL